MHLRVRRGACSSSSTTQEAVQQESAVYDLLEADTFHRRCDDDQVDV